jgi:Flp pilus assembly protein TadG
MTDRKGSAAVEFAMVLPILLTCLAILADFGLASEAKGSLAAATAAGAQYASAIGPDVTPAAIVSVVRGQLAATVTVMGPECGCVSAATMIPEQCQATCPNGTRPGTYVTIAARRRYTPILPLYSRLAPLDMTDMARVRLK